MRGGLVVLMSIGALLQLELPGRGEWPTQAQVRTLTLSAAGIGAGPVVAAAVAGEPRTDPIPSGRVRRHLRRGHDHRDRRPPGPRRNARLRRHVGAMVMFKSGIALPSAVAALAFVTLIVATVRLARDDQKATEQRSSSGNAGRLAEQLVREVEEHGDGWFWQTDRQGHFTYLSAKVASEFARLGITTAGARLIDTFRIDTGSGDTERTLNFHLSTRTSFSDIRCARRPATTATAGGRSRAGRCSTISAGSRGSSGRAAT